jgi:lipopolysaccharide/colanic/teichoic acid biosynthesis glycosyltransferase
MTASPVTTRTATPIRPALWSGYDWVDRVRPEDRIITGRPYHVLKRVFDLVVVIAAAPAWVPLLAVCALIVKLDDPSGPIFYTQRRAGHQGREFGMHKFRTMVPNAHEMKQELQHLNELPLPYFKITNDPRITGPGRILRTTSLDELPQLWDVLRGRMTLVGPRPTDFMADTYALWQTERLDVKPGITGLWQLYGRGLTDMDDSTRLDIAYVQRRSLWLDLQILVRTVPAVLTQRGAK